MHSDWHMWEEMDDECVDLEGNPVTLWGRYTSPLMEEREYCLTERDKEPSKKSSANKVSTLPDLVSKFGIELLPGLVLSEIRRMTWKEEKNPRAFPEDQALMLCEAGLGGKGSVRNFELSGASCAEASIRAIAARIQGEWDCPPLVALGPLSTNAPEDIEKICELTLEADIDLRQMEKMETGHVR